MAKAKEKNTNKKELTVKIEGKEWQTALDKAFNEKVKTVTVDGFRKGKCPRDVFEKKYGSSNLSCNWLYFINLLV